jgi:hypothetical protein
MKVEGETGRLLQDKEHHEMLQNIHSSNHRERVVPGDSMKSMALIVNPWPSES